MELFMNLFPGIGTFMASEPSIIIARIVLIALGFILAYYGFKRKLEPLIKMCIRDRAMEEGAGNE